MPAPAAVSLAEDTMRQIGEATQTLRDVRSKVSTLKVDPTQKDTRRHGLGGSTTFKVSNNLQDVLDSLNALTQSLAQPGLAPADLKWNTQGKLKKLLAASHPQCPGQERNWNISRVSGKCTEERLMNTKPTVATPKTVSPISQLKLPELVDEMAGTGALLVVICLATYALEQSNYAKLLAERVHTELMQRLGPSGREGVRFVAIELTEMCGFAQRYGVKEVPYCLMFQGGVVVYSKRLRGMRLLPKDAGTSQPHVLLVEPSPAQQLKLERAIRRSGCSWDLSMDGSQALRLASRSLPYDAVLLSGALPTTQQRSVASAVKRVEPGAMVMVFDACSPPPEEDPAIRGRFLEECNHVFPYSPSYTALMAVLSRCETDDKRRPAGAGLDKRELLDEVLGVLERGKRSAAAASAG